MDPLMFLVVDHLRSARTPPCTSWTGTCSWPRWWVTPLP